jgi:hypothetical protein
VPSVERLDPLELLQSQEPTRLPWLVPVRRSRMARSPLAFLRGGAVVMAADLARQPHSGLMVQLCGDAHLMNFGFYASPERSLLFDINDFDETHPGPFEWDLVRLATSLVLAARSLALEKQDQQRICRSAVRAYARTMAELAGMPRLAMWVWRPDLEPLLTKGSSELLRSHLMEVTTRARRRDSRQAVRKLCEVDPGGALRIRHDPPLILRFEAYEGRWQGEMSWQEWVDHAVKRYKESLRPEIRHLLSRFHVCDVAFKAVGVGSIGTRCAIGLLQGDQPDDVLVLQSKQAQNSVLAPYVEASVPEHQGERVVHGQRLMQTASDQFLGWTTSERGSHFYWRHFRDWKSSVDITCLDGAGLRAYGKLCASSLAKAHCRSGNGWAISNLLGDGKAFSGEILARALEQAELTERDHLQLQQALNEGRLEGRELL